MAAAAPSAPQAARAAHAPAARLEFLDGLRGFAALMVVIHHLPTFVAAPAWVSALTLGNPWVTIFITLSGFCLYLPAAARPGVEMPRPFWDFMRRRAKRIVAPWYASLALCTLVGLWLRHVGYVHASGFVPENGWDVLTHLTLTHSLTRYSGTINGPGYTLGFEWQLYILMIGLIWIVRRAGWAPLLCVVAALSAAPIPGEAGVFLRKLLAPPFALPFVLGMLGARLARRPLRLALLQTARGQAAEPWLFALIALGGVAGYLVINPSNHDLACWFAGIATAAGCVFMARRPRSLAARLFGSAPGRALGAFSYSLYLTHFALLAVTAALAGAGPDGRAPAEAFWRVFVPALPLYLLFAWGFFLVFERPFLNAAPRTAPIPARANSLESAT